MNFLFLNWSENPSENPIVNRMIIVILWICSMINSCSADNNQDNHDPEVIANRLKIKIGI